jgi:hypothetical protein
MCLKVIGVPGESVSVTTKVLSVFLDALSIKIPLQAAKLVSVPEALTINPLAYGSEAD